RLFEYALCVAAAHDNVYLETGLWWADLYGKALRDPNVGAEKLLWGCDWGASIPSHTQLGSHPPVYAVQLRNKPIVRHQVDVWGWSLKQLLRLDIAQEDSNLVSRGNRGPCFPPPPPPTPLFRPVGDQLVPRPDERDSVPPKCG